MPNFFEYNPEQAYLLPPSVRDVLREDHICFFVHRVVERLDLRLFEAGYSGEGHPAYHPALMLKVWLYAYALGVTSSRRLEQRVREDLAFRYLAGGAQPDFWALNEFRKRHRRAINDVFTQVVELARSLGMGKLGHVAIDSTRIAANAAADSADTIGKLRAERARIRWRIRHWQRQCDAEDPNEAGGTELPGEMLGQLERKLAGIPGRIEGLKKSGLKQLSRTDPDSRFLRQRGGFVLGYTATVAVSEDHFVVAQQVSQVPSDHDLLVPMVGAVQEQCGEPPQQASPDQRIFSVRTRAGVRSPGDRRLHAGLDAGAGVEHREASEARGRGSGAGPGPSPVACEAAQPRRTRHLSTQEGDCGTGGRRIETTRHAPVSSAGLAKVAVEFTLAAIAYNLTRIRAVQSVV